MTQLRGANLGLNKSPADINALITNGANCIRWNMINMNADTQTPDEYREWLNIELVNLTVAPTTAKKIICLFYPPGGRRFYIDKTWQDIFVNTWKHIVDISNNPDIAGYDLINEPAMSARTWGLLAEKTVRRIKRIDKTRPVYVSSRYGTVTELLHMRPIDGVDNYTCHFYDPLEYTHQGVYPQFPYPVQYTKRQAIPQLEKILNWSRKYKKRVYIGEFSAARWSPGCVDFLSDVTTFLNAHHWDWTYHAWREAHTWDLEYPDTFCPDGSCLGPRIQTDRLEVLKAAWTR